MWKWEEVTNQGLSPCRTYCLSLATQNWLKPQPANYTTPCSLNYGEPLLSLKPHLCRDHCESFLGTSHEHMPLRGGHLVSKLAHALQPHKNVSHIPNPWPKP